jgi:hypothetical protein
MLMVSSLDVLRLWSNAKTLDLAGALWAVSFVLAFPISLGAVLGVALGVVVHAIEASATGKRDRRSTTGSAW